MLPAVSDIERLLAALPDVTVAEEHLGVVARVALADAGAAMAALKTAGYESLVDFDGIDTGELIEITYRVRSYALDLDVFVKTSVAYEGTIESVIEILWSYERPAAMSKRSGPA